MTIKVDMIDNLKQLECLDNDELLNSKKKIAIHWFTDLRTKCVNLLKTLKKIN